MWVWILQWLFWKSFNCDKWTSLWWFMGLNYSAFMSIKMISIHWGILGICVVHWSNCKKRCFCVCSSSWFTGLGRPACFLCMTTHRPGNCLQKNLQAFTFIPFYIYLFLLQWSISLVLVTAGRDKTFITLSCCDTLLPCISLFLLDLCLRHT